MYMQSEVWSWIQGNITLADTSVDPAVRARAYLMTERLAVAMGLFVYVCQYDGIWYFRSWLKGYEMQENPMIGADYDLVFYWLTKG
jgi:hypothetical protein